MEIYLVGGAVRDSLLGLPIKERDWVVVGATPQDLLNKGYKAVGKDFPVFLHPQSKEEYALARTERKTAPGYKGFITDFSSNVTLEEDLKRRDLTINAIAQDKHGNIIDPYNGRVDLKNKILRHVSEAFSEDPVRILRLARFYARFANLGFTIDADTNKLMRAMVNDGEVDALVPERVWKEAERALAAVMPQKFFEALNNCTALAKLFPEIYNLYGVPNPAKYHPEIDSGVHTMMVLEQAAILSNSTKVRFAALVHDLGKATTPKAVLPSHHGHEGRGVKLVAKLCARFKISKDYQKLAVKVTEFHGQCHRAFELRADTIARLLKQLDAFRNPDLFFDFLLACKADSRGRTGFENIEYPQADYLAQCYQAARAIKSTPFLEDGLEGEKLAKAMYEAQVQAIQNIKNNLVMSSLQKFGLSDKNFNLILSALQSFTKIEHVIIFGSRAMGNFKPGSDIDLALIGEIDQQLLAKIKAKLDEEIATPYLFDVVAYNDLDKNDTVVKHINTFGIQLY